MKCAHKNCDNQRAPGSIFCAEEHERSGPDETCNDLPALPDNDNPTRRILLLGLELSMEEHLRALTEQRVAAENDTARNPCCGNVGSHREGRSEYCNTCGAELLRRAVT